MGVLPDFFMIWLAFEESKAQYCGTCEGGDVVGRCQGKFIKFFQLIFQFLQLIFGLLYMGDAGGGLKIDVKVLL